jgi:ankyrin repeat protein
MKFSDMRLSLLIGIAAIGAFGTVLAFRYGGPRQKQQQQGSMKGRITDSSSETSKNTAQALWPFGKDNTPASGVPLIDAVRSKDETAIRSILSQNPKNADAVDPSTGQNALHIIASRNQGHYKYPPDGIPKLLISSGIDINAKDKSGKTALEISLLSGWQKISYLLLDAGADRGVVTQDTVSAITCPDCKRVVREYKLAQQ